VLGEHLDRVYSERNQGRGGQGGEQVKTEVFPDESRTVINRVDSEDIPFNWSLNPYRGCEHGCIYCYARPYHEYLGLSLGVDFETKIFAKFDAPELLKKELASPKWKGEVIAMAGVTDVYQPIERELKITRRCLELIAHCRQPVGIVTKNRLVLRDLELLKELARYRAVCVGVSVTTLEHELAARMEPRASSPSDRLEAIRELSGAGVPVLAMVAPIIPGLNDREIPALLKAVAEAGAGTASYTLLRLPYQIKELFLDWLSRHYPDRARHVESLIRDTRSGELYDSRVGIRHRGEGQVAEQIGRVFKVFSKRYGLNRSLRVFTKNHFRPPESAYQMRLF
jgi:DNA repair photolyase